MDLHRAGKTPDWAITPSTKRNIWQRIAAATGGYLTPANVLSVLGAGLSITGIVLIASHQLIVGTVLLAVGRLLDAVDGIIADRTGTKSRSGGLVDAGLDKLVIFAALITLAVLGLVPVWPAKAIIFLNGLSALCTLIAGRRNRLLQPSAAGKLAMGCYWAAILGFLASRLAPSLLSPVHALYVAYACTFLSLALGAYASVGYLHIAFGRQREAIKSVFGRYIIIRNPASTDAGPVRERIRQLRALQPKAEVATIETRPGGRNANARLLHGIRKHLDGTALIGIAAGDGTVNLIVDLLLHDPALTTEQRQTPILPLWGGNANDLANMLNGAATRSKLRRLLQHGHVVSIRPIICTLSLPDGSRQVYAAACYASFGASAYATEELERTVRKSPMRRFGGTRFGQEVIAVFRALVEVPTFRTTQKGRTKEMFERTYLNGSRFAKVIGAPLKLTDEAFHMAMIEHKHIVAVLLHVLGLADGREGARITMTRDSFILEDAVWAQFDGEAVRVPRGTEVTIVIGDQPFNALSTRLRSVL